MEDTIPSESATCSIKTNKKLSESSDMASIPPFGLHLIRNEFFKAHPISIPDLSRSKQHIALKILTADSFGTGHDTFELDILKHLRRHDASNFGANHLLGLLDEFEHHGPHGNHVCFVFKAMGPDMTKYRRLFPKPKIPLPLVREIPKQLLLALSHLHDTCAVIHTG